jgi:hypothetical protein
MISNLYSSNVRSLAISFCCNITSVIFNVYCHRQCGKISNFYTCDLYRCILHMFPYVSIHVACTQALQSVATGYHRPKYYSGTTVRGDKGVCLHMAWCILLAADGIKWFNEQFSTKIKQHFKTSKVCTALVHVILQCINLTAIYMTIFDQTSVLYTSNMIRM